MTNLRVGVLWRGDAGATRPAEDRGLGPLFDAFAKLPVDVVPIPFSDGRVEEVRNQLSRVDGVLVWVNPIQDGADRRNVDELLREAAAAGIWVSAHPDVIRKMGTKEVLFHTRHLGWGSDTFLYHSADELAERLADRLATRGRLVVKQGRGNGGNGVWSIELVEPVAAVSLHSPVRVREARAKEPTSERITLGEFVERCRAYFSWSDVLVDQEYQRRLADGLVRCYFSHDELVGFCHQWPKGLLDADPASPPNEDRRVSEMQGPDAPGLESLRRRCEAEWVPEMARLFTLDARELPVIWDADFLFGTRGDDGDGPSSGYVLCEINVSAVWPFPPMASATIARNTVGRIGESMRARGGRRPMNS